MSLIINNFVYNKVIICYGIVITYVVKCDLEITTTTCELGEGLTGSLNTSRGLILLALRREPAAFIRDKSRGRI